MSNTIQCELCPKYCVIRPGESGDCRIRVNLDGRLLAVTYGFPCAINLDPVEKKPLFHFLPGSKVLSVATAGCNLHCSFCQNWEISQETPDQVDAHHVPPAALIKMAQKYRCPGIAYTYTEPLVFYEYTLDCSIAASDAGLKNVLVTAGYINRAPFRELCRHIHAANIDLKAYSDKFYRDVCGGTLRPVLDSLVLAKEMNVELEITNLIIPGLNDQDKLLEDLAKWVVNNLGKEIPVHFSRFVPRYRMRNLPPTPDETLGRARDIALAAGLSYVYAGNILREEWLNTYCPGCKFELVRRAGYVVTANVIKNEQCPKCGQKIYGVWQ